MVPHLSKCVFVTPDVRARAVEEINGKKTCAHENPPMLGRSVSMPLLAFSTGLDQGHQAPYPTSGTPSPAPSPLLLSAPLLNLLTPTETT